MSHLSRFPFVAQRASPAAAHDTPNKLHDTRTTYFPFAQSRIQSLFVSHVYTNRRYLPNLTVSEAAMSSTWPKSRSIWVLDSVTTKPDMTEVHTDTSDRMYRRR